MAGLSTLLSPWSLFLGALILVVLAIIILTVIERKLNKKVLIKKEEEETHFQRQIDGVRSFRSDQKKFLNAIDGLARDFFASKFDMSKGMMYSDFIREFRKKDNKRAVKFCIKMQETLYSGEEVNDDKLSSLMRELEMFIMDEENREKEEKNLKGGYWQQEVELGRIKKALGEKEEDKEEGVKEDEDGRVEIESDELREEIDDEEKDEKDLEEMRRQKNRELEKKTEAIKKESALASSELNQTPLEKTEIKISKVKKRKTKADERIGSIDNLDRLKSKIRERRQMWAIHGVGID